MRAQRSNLCPWDRRGATLFDEFMDDHPATVFCFGGSATVVFGEPDAWRPAGDIVEHARQNIETLARLGGPIARAGRAA